VILREFEYATRLHTYPERAKRYSVSESERGGTKEVGERMGRGIVESVGAMLLLPKFRVAVRFQSTARRLLQVRQSGRAAVEEVTSYTGR